MTTKKGNPNTLFNIPAKDSLTNMVVETADYVIKKDPTGEYLIRMHNNAIYYQVNEEDLDYFNCGEMNRRAARRGYNVVVHGPVYKLLYLTRDKP